MILIEGEKSVGTCRPLLPLFMAGQVNEEKVSLFKPAEDPLLTVKTGARVRSLDKEGKAIQLESGEALSFERLILAPGGQPIIPWVEGIDGLEGVFPVRNLPVAEKVRNWITRDSKIVVLGGGLVGVKTAVYLRTAGFPVAIVEKEPHLLPQALRPDAAAHVEEHFQKMGINLHLGQTLEAAGGERGKITKAKAGGQWIPCHALLLAIGSVPNISFLEGSGLLEEGRLRVSAALQTKNPRIFAAGDAVTIFTPDGKSYTPWTWPQAVSQGKLAAANLYRSNPLPLRALTRVNSMNLQGLALNMLGAFVDGSEEICYGPPLEGILRQVFLREGQITGGALLGDITGAGPLHYSMIRGHDSNAQVRRLIKPSLRLMSPGLWEKGIERRRARLIPGEGKQTC